MKSNAVIDCDGHLLEPPDLWERYIPGDLKKKAPRVVKFLTHMISHPFEQMLAALSIIAGGVLERFPRLRVAFLESGCGWLPFWLHRMDEHYERRAHEVPWLTMRPSDYFRRQCIISCDPDEVTIPAVVDYIGEDHVCWASDYPHWDAIFPGAVAELRKHLNGLSEAAHEKILGDNARRFLDLDGNESRTSGAGGR
jgi:predicted TIM-barrel fold metal-dependent hydrolase